ncbi:3-keto-5-aminohexanoate cleavage protein [Streptomyces sp. NPDC005803]|uniref:3-keto-5-aminohexanoate cleavage protein n=1 Tax=Streptomyces sp. NPDC005803 TaxID=3154297 RepID=UPI00340D6320
MLQVCLNGARTRTECPVLPISPTELATAAQAAVAAGAQDIHLHPKTPEGEDTLEPHVVAAAVTAVRAAVPNIAVGVTTGAWTLPDPAQRAAHIRSWTVLPDHASVNWHEDGASDVAAALLERGIGIEAGIYSGTRATQRFLAWPEAHRVLRVLAEVTDSDPQTVTATAAGLISELSPAAEAPLLLHGEGPASWPLLLMASSRDLSMRIGLEDVLHLPDGTTAEDNASLVRAARDMIESMGTNGRTSAPQR